MWTRLGHLYLRSARPFVGVGAVLGGLQGARQYYRLLTATDARRNREVPAHWNEWHCFVGYPLLGALLGYVYPLWVPLVMFDIVAQERGP